METNEGEIRRILETYFSTAQNSVDTDEMKSLLITLLSQNLEVSRKSEDPDSSTKLSEATTVEQCKQAQRIACEIEKEANARASAIIADAQRKAEVQIKGMKTEAERRTEDVIQEKFKTATLERLAIIQLAIEGAEAEAKKAIHDARKEVESLQMVEREPAKKEPQSVAEGENGRAAQRDERLKYHSQPRRAEKGILRYRWNVEIERQQHKIEILLNIALGLFPTGGGRLLVDGETVHDWGCNPFALIPKGVLKFQVAGRTLFVRTRGTITKYPVLVLGNKEIPAVSTKV
jgi:hypothetical protein